MEGLSHFKLYTVNSGYLYTRLKTRKPYIFVFPIPLWNVAYITWWIT